MRQRHFHVRKLLSVYNTNNLTELLRHWRGPAVSYWRYQQTWSHTEEIGKDGALQNKGYTIPYLLWRLVKRFPESCCEFVSVFLRALKNVICHRVNPGCLVTFCGECSLLGCSLPGVKYDRNEVLLIVIEKDSYCLWPVLVIREAKFVGQKAAGDSKLSLRLTKLWVTSATSAILSDLFGENWYYNYWSQWGLMCNLRHSSAGCIIMDGLGRPAGSASAPYPENAGD